MEKLTLKDLELSIPSVSLVDARNMLGGSGYGEDPTLDGGELPEVTVEARPDDGPERPDGPEPFDDDRDDDDRHETPDRDEENSDDEGREEDDDKVKVPNGECALGAMAAAIQDILGCSAEEALNKAEEALEKLGINPHPGEGESGVEISGEDINEALNSIEGIETFNGEMTLGDLAEWFNDDGVGIGHYENEDGSYHNIELTDYDRESDSFHYYDPVTGEEGDIDRGDLEDLVLIH